MIKIEKLCFIIASVMIIVKKRVLPINVSILLLLSFKSDNILIKTIIKAQQQIINTTNLKIIILIIIAKKQKIIK